MDERISLSSPDPQAGGRSIDTYLELAARDASSADQNIKLKYWGIFLSLSIANSSDASEILCLSYILAQPKFAGMGPTTSSLLAAAVFGGMLIGGLVVGALGDCWGRKSTLSAGLALTSICGLVSSATPSAGVLAMIRFGSGLGIGATVPPLFSLASELAPPQHRGREVAVVASGWMVGAMFVAFMGWWILSVDYPHNWRWFLVVCALPSAIGWVLVKSIVPESPRFLALEGKAEEAAQVARHLADALGYKGYPLQASEVVSHYEYASTRLSPSRRITSWVAMCRLFTDQARKLYTPTLAQCTWPLQALWFALSFGSYGLMTWINTLFVQVHLENVYGNAMLFSLANLPGNVLSALLIDIIGRSKLLVMSITLAALSLIAFAYVAAQETADVETEHYLPKYWIVGAAFSFQCFSIAAWNAIDVLSSELFPTDVRSTGLGLCTASGRIGAMLAQIVNGHLVGNPARLLMVAAATLLFGACTPVFLPTDLTGQAVEDVSDIPSDRQVIGTRETYSDDEGREIS